jgi:nucleoside-diphosphate-sugar epimerase
MPVPTPETHPLVDNEAENRFSYLIAATEQAVFRYHPGATVFRYPGIYGPRQVMPREWSVVRRILDHRPHIVLTDSGLSLHSAMYAENAAEAVLLAVDRPEVTAGQVYNVADDAQLTLRELVELIAATMNHTWEIVSFPYGEVARQLAFFPIKQHCLADTQKARTELGYRDVVTPVEGIRRTVAWLLANQPERGGEVEKRLIDAFDYDAEDQLAALWHATASKLKDIKISREASYSHPYAHPKKPGEAKDQRGR